MDDGIGNGRETRTNKEQRPKKRIQFNNSTEIRTYRPNKPIQPRRKQTKKGKNSISKIRLMNVNIRGTNSKTESLKSAIMTYKPEIVCLQETMLDPLRAPKIEGYKWIIKQRQNKLGGGIAIMINNNIQHITKVKQDTEENEEIQWVKIKTQ